MRTIRPGMTEFQAEATFLHHVYFHGGARYRASSIYGVLQKKTLSPDHFSVNEVQNLLVCGSGFSETPCSSLSFYDNFALISGTCATLASVPPVAVELCCTTVTRVLPTTRSSGTGTWCCSTWELSTTATAGAAAPVY